MRIFRQTGRFLVEYVLGIASLILAIIALYLQGDKTLSNEMQVIIISLLIYQGVLLAIVWSAVQQVRTYAGAASKGEQFRKAIEYSDNSFRKLADKRSEFDQDGFSAAIIGSFDQKALDHALTVFLSEICDATSEIISMRKGFPPGDCPVNIKLFANSDRGTKYFVAAGSKSYGEERNKAHDERGYRYLLHKNICFWSIIDGETKGYFLENDMENLIFKNTGDKFEEPNNSALRYYTKCLIVPIAPSFVNRGRLDWQEDTLSGSRVKTTVIGMLTIDSKNADLTFDDRFDLGIMKEMSIYAYSAHHQHKLLKRVGKGSPTEKL